MGEVLHFRPGAISPRRNRENRELAREIAASPLIDEFAPFPNYDERRTALEAYDPLQYAAQTETLRQFNLGLESEDQVQRQVAISRFLVKAMGDLDWVFLKISLLQLDRRPPHGWSRIDPIKLNPTAATVVVDRIAERLALHGFDRADVSPPTPIGGCWHQG